MKHIKILLPIFFLLTLVPLGKAWAAPLDARLTQEAGRALTIASNEANRQATALQNLQNRANEMISTRITSLTTLLSRIQSDTRLTADQKTTLTNSINTMISNLQALKTKIDADTDLTTARADTKTIVTSYHVYVTFEPQLRLLLIVNNLQTTAGNIQNLVPLLQNLSATLKGEGKNTTTIDSAIADMSTQLTNINTLLSGDSTTLNAVVLTNNTYQATFTQVRQDLAKVRADFAQIQHDMATIMAAVKSLGGKPTTSPTASTSAK